MPYFFLPCRCVFLPPRREQHILLFFPYGSDVSPSGEVGTPARRRKGGAGYGAAPANLMPNSALRVWAASVGNAAGRKGTDISR